jgi:hypothetical protein
MNGTQFDFVTKDGKIYLVVKTLVWGDWIVKEVEITEKLLDQIGSDVKEMVEERNDASRLREL